MSTLRKVAIVTVETRPLGVISQHTSHVIRGFVTSPSGRTILFASKPRRATSDALRRVVLDCTSWIAASKHLVEQTPVSIRHDTFTQTE